MSDLTYQDVIRILNLIDSAGSVDFELVSGDLRLKVSRKAQSHATLGTEPAMAATPKAAPIPPPEPSRVSEPNGHTDTVLNFPDATPVTAPMGGIFYAAPAPGKPAFVEIGQKVHKGDQLGIVEVMKLFTPVMADAEGTIVAILVENQQTVAKDEVLMFVRAGD